MMFHTAISGGVFLGPLINAYIVQYAGWRVRNISLYAISRASNHRQGGCIMLPALSGLPSPRKTILLIRRSGCVDSWP
jgi:MFS family permease